MELVANVGFPSPNGDLYFIGIIDFFQQYTLQKKIESIIILYYLN